MKEVPSFPKGWGMLTFAEVSSGIIDGTPEVLELLAGREILKPPSLLEGALVGQMLNGLVIRSKLRIKPAPQLKTFGPFVTGNARTDGFFPE